MKKERFKNIIKAIKPFVRGVLKSIPFGSVAIEIADNIKTEKSLMKGEVPTRVKLVDGETKAPHNWISILFQVICAGLIVYAFVTKQITIDQVLNYLNLFSENVNDNPVNLTTLTDTIQ